MAKSERARAGAMLEVELDEPATGPSVQPRRVEGLHVVHEDADIVVVDKPVGVAAHPSVGWVGPDVVSGLARQIAHGLNRVLRPLDL